MPSPCRACYCVVMCLLLSVIGSAQTNSQIRVESEPVMLPPGSIEGRLHPEQIPDKTAYRLVFRAFSESPQATSEEVHRQQVKLAAIGLDQSDLVIASEVLADYHVRYASYLQRYEAEMEKAKNGLVKINHAAYAAERDDVVDSTINEFRARLSEAGMAKLQAFVQNEKRRMTIVPNPPMS